MIMAASGCRCFSFLRSTRIAIGSYTRRKTHSIPHPLAQTIVSRQRHWPVNTSALVPVRLFADVSADPLGEALVDSITYENVCQDTLESLCEYFEELVENSNHLKYADVSYNDGVLTVNLGSAIGTYVINRQSPNRQIWLSSPKSGPKRYDFVTVAKSESNVQGYWLYRHDSNTLHELLQTELKDVFSDQVDFHSLPFGKK